MLPHHAHAGTVKDMDDTTTTTTTTKGAAPNPVGDRDAELTARLGDTADVVTASVVAYGETADGVRVAHKGSTHGTGTPFSVSREQREEVAELLLAPGATRARGAGHRAIPEDPDPVRTCFEKDLDRVRYSPGFRRLAHKCQVFIAPNDAHLRTRLTHALEVAQVAVAVSRAIGLNTALTEAAAIAHDCGHGPAGHASEEALSPYLDTGYDHAVYGADVILAPLNLCTETLDAVRNHSWRRPTPATPEGEVVAWADRIAYVAHDWDDAVRAGIVAPADLPREVADVVGSTQSAQIGAFISEIAATVAATGRIGMREPYASALDAFRRVNYELIYLRPAARQQAERVITLLSALTEYFIDAPGQIPDVAAGRIEHPRSGSADAAAAAVRYVSSMTDRYALGLGVELLGFPPERLPAGVG
jgi:dGTPase